MPQFISNELITTMNNQTSRLCKLICTSALLIASKTALALSPLGTPPTADQLPRSEFVFEERVTLDPAVKVGDTPFGFRQYIPITGGKIAGPKLNGEVLPGGWDYQLWLGNGCGTLSADYFLKADDGIVIHILNQAFTCNNPQTKDERSFFQPRFEAPKGKYEWMNRSSFVATLELEMAPADANKKEGEASKEPKLAAVRIKFYQIR